MIGGDNNWTNRQIHFFAPPCAGHNCDTGGGKPTLTHIPQIQHVCLAAGSEHMAPLKIFFLTGIVAEALPPLQPVGNASATIPVRKIILRGAIC